jgi:hypothetical protein
LAITEEDRHQLYARLREVLGDDEATTMMEHLPPVGWADVATKRDLDHLAVLTTRDLDHHAAMFRAELHEHAAVVDARLKELAVLMDARFNEHAARFDLVDARFDLVDARFTTMEERFGRLLEASLRQQVHRFLGVNTLLLTLVLTLDRVLGG